MLITRTKVRGFKAVTIKDIPTRIATRHYFAYQEVEGREIKLIITKKREHYGTRRTRNARKSNLEIQSAIF